MRHVIVLSGAIAAGKSTLAGQLASECNATLVSTREIIKKRARTIDRRDHLQADGDALDEATQGKWVAEAIADDARDPRGVVVVDAIRKSFQLDHIRERWPGKVTHIHLRASEEVSRQRFEARAAERAEGVTFQSAANQVTEAQVSQLSACADFIISTDTGASSHVFARALTCLRTRLSGPVDVVVGGQWGSEGKGNICAYLATNYDVLVRGGGPNAGHKVRDPDFTFRHLPSGAAHNKGARLMLAAGATLSPQILLQEIADLEKIDVAVASRLIIDPRAMIIEDGDRRYEEDLASIGSTKQGVGAAAARKILGRSGNPELGVSKVRLARHVEEFQPYLGDVADLVAQACVDGQRILIEGTQGTGLSLHHGDWPHVTSRDTTVAACLSEIGLAPSRVRRVIMICRTFPIRVAGKSGEMGKEITWQDVSEVSAIEAGELKEREKGSVSGNLRRVAEVDFARLKHAAILNGATDIALTFVDYLGVENQKAVKFEDLNARAKDFVDRLERVVKVPVSLLVTDGDIRHVITRGYAP